MSGSAAALESSLAPLSHRFAASIDDNKSSSQIENTRPIAPSEIADNQNTHSPKQWASDEERLRSFGAALDAIKQNIETQVGTEDLQHVRRLDYISRAFEVAGRLLIHFSFEPVTFTAGVLALWVHKQLQATEIGHTALHGAYDKIDGAGRFRSTKFHWQVPIDEESWRLGHNVKHHGYTNIAGKDPDIHFGPVRLTEHTPHRFVHYFQVPLAFLVTFPVFGFTMNLHFTGVNDVYGDNGLDKKFDVLPDRSWRSILRAHWHAVRKYLPYYGKELVLFPLLAGPGFLKVIAGNMLSELLRDLYSAATIYCGHVGGDTAAFPEGTKAHNKGQWYAMQAASSNNFSVPHLVSIFCGGLDLQIEHHMFPRLPPARLRQIAPEVRQACIDHNIPYRSEGWGRTLLKAFAHIAKLSAKPNGVGAAIREGA